MTEYATGFIICKMKYQMQQLRKPLPKPMEAK